MSTATRQKGDESHCWSIQEISSQKSKLQGESMINFTSPLVK
jgi:hypothetical protein